MSEKTYLRVYELLLTDGSFIDDLKQHTSLRIRVTHVFSACDLQTQNESNRHICESVRIVISHSRSAENTLTDVIT